VTLDIYIERLIVDGVDLGPGDGERLKAAVEAELSRLLSHGELAQDLKSGGAFPSIRAGSRPVSGEGNPARLGKQIAQSVYQGIGETSEQSSHSDQSGR